MNNQIKVNQIVNQKVDFVIHIDLGEPKSIASAINKFILEQWHWAMLTLLHCVWHRS